MGTIKQGILGAFSGKVGGVIGGSWKGIATMRSMPASVLNPRTTAQVNQRTSFKSISELGAVILTSIVKPLNDRFAQRMSGFNAFCMRNKSVFTGAGVFNGLNLLISSGKLGDAVITDATCTAGVQSSIEFPTAPVGAFESATDKVYAVVLDDSGALVGVSSGVVQRSAGVVLMNAIKSVSDGDVVFCYLSFVRADGSIVANSAVSQIVAQA